jgi:hypothetical protein
VGEAYKLLTAGNTPITLETWTRVCQLVRPDFTDTQIL